MLELDDIQYILLTRAPAITGRYEFLSFRNAAAGRAWLAAILETVHSVQQARASLEKDNRWVSVAFTWNGLRALGADEGSLASFPEEFKQGMVARAEVLGDTGANHPENWLGGLASPDLHAIVILFARDVAERERCEAEHQRLVAQCDGVEVLSSLDLEATPPFDYAHDHFGYRDRMSQPVIEGSGEQPTPGSGAPLKAGEFILGYPDEAGPSANQPQPEILSRNGSYMAYRRLQEHVGAFRDFLRQNGQTRRGTGTFGCEAHGTLAQRGTASAVARQGRPGARRRSAAEQRLQLQANGPARLCGAARLPRAPHESPRHGGEYEPAADDPPRRHLRPASAGRRAGGRHRARHRRIRDLREPHPPVRVRAERVGERSEFSRARQRARSDHRQPGWNARIQNPEASDPKKNHRSSGIHHRPGRRLFFSAWPQGASIPCVTR